MHYLGEREYFYFAHSTQYAFRRLSMLAALSKPLPPIEVHGPAKQDLGSIDRFAYPQYVGGAV